MATGIGTAGTEGNGCGGRGLLEVGRMNGGMDGRMAGILVGTAIVGVVGERL